MAINQVAHMQSESVTLKSILQLVSRKRMLLIERIGFFEFVF